MTTGSRFSKPAQRYLVHQEFVRMMALKAAARAGLDMLTGPLSVIITIYLAGGRDGDLDNYAKAILDGCNTTRARRGIWKDDRQVMTLLAKKVFVAEKKDERTEIAVSQRERSEPKNEKTKST